MPSVTVYDNPHALARAAAEFISRLAQDAIHHRGCCAVALSGGGTPKLTYEYLRRTSAAPDWSKMYVFWSDERCVPPDHPDSNFRMAHESLLAHVPVPQTHIRRMDCSPTPEAGAERYESYLREWVREHGEPIFDLVMLGLGLDGHTASLFPGTPALDEGQRWVVANRVEKLEAWRMTLTYPALSAAGSILFLVQGSDKAAVVKAVLQGGLPELPATTVGTPSKDPVWLLDAAAAAGLDASFTDERKGAGSGNDG